CMEALEFPYNF
nr:immunoglobulin light chain junction region [Macaca mulatta]MOX27114.1 immunoglobulin light chain junction region [Macaca mulatta]